MRITKEAEERRNEILDVADRLFCQKGFDGTSTNDILKEVGIARGTLYYHFKSKEEIMNAIIDRYNQKISHAATLIARNKAYTVEERILQVLMSMKLSQYTEQSEELIEQIHKPQNAYMHQKSQKGLITHIIPILANLIEEGIEEGKFNTPVPYECMEMVFVYAMTLLDGDIIELPKEEIFSRLKALQINIERLLGCEEGALAEWMNCFASTQHEADY